MSDICQSCDLLTIENYELKTEIERLLAVIEDADLSRSLLLDDFSNERAQVERLRAGNEQAYRRMDVAITKSLELAAEIERLKAELATCRELREHDSKEIVALRAEREQWKRSHEAYRQFYYDEERARRALEQKS